MEGGVGDERMEGGRREVEGRDKRREVREGGEGWRDGVMEQIQVGIWIYIPPSSPETGIHV